MTSYGTKTPQLQKLGSFFYCKYGMSGEFLLRAIFEFSWFLQAAQ